MSIFWLEMGNGDSFRFVFFLGRLWEVGLKWVFWYFWEWVRCKFGFVGSYVVIRNIFIGYGVLIKEGRICIWSEIKFLWWYLSIDVVVFEVRYDFWIF